MNNKIPKTSSNIFNCCRTSCDTFSADYQWEIRNVSFFISGSTQSPVFSTSNEDKVKWQLIFYPQFSWSNIKYSCIFLKLVDCNSEELYVSCSCSIIKNNGFEYRRFFSHCYMKKDTTEGFDCFIKYEDLINNEYVKDDTLHIKCNVKWCPLNFSYQTQHVHNFDFDHEYPKNIISFYKNERFSDVCLEVNGVQFRVHKIILAIRSSVFHAMFRNKMYENQDVIKIYNMKPEIMRAIISFVYTNHVHDFELNTIKLLKAAEMYNLNGLKLLCEKSLCESFTVDNVGEILHAAMKYNAEKLKREVINFIKNEM